jgi:hypothetical protein
VIFGWPPGKHVHNRPILVPRVFSNLVAQVGHSGEVSLPVTIARSFEAVRVEQRAIVAIDRKTSATRL